MESRRQKSKTDWHALIQQQAESGQKNTEFCKAHKLTPSSFYNWKSKLSTSKPDFKAIKIGSTKVKGKIKCTLPNGMRFEWDETVSDQVLTTTLKVYADCVSVLMQRANCGDMKS